ncbi:helix-turn-helix domain-containing protein [Roseivivax sp. GX 12232]|uniref:helix-turn-helix domain-containing protein n=1 Tax=Roseivivax sp. GX 12232 TaxID=2900547 RepID=UPI00351D36BD
MSITGLQIRVARTALNWTVQDLSDATGVGTATIARYELAAGKLPKSRKNNLETLRTCFEAAGIEFLGSAGNRPGLTWSADVSTPS